MENRSIDQNAELELYKNFLKSLVGKISSGNHKKLEKILGDAVPSTHVKQANPYSIAEEYISRKSGLNLLDLGCSTGATRARFLKVNSTINWRGVDIQDSFPGSELKNRIFSRYDGVNIPYEDGYFDIIFSRQVFEHVEKPFSLLQDVARTLKPGGVFLGSVSGIEAYHGCSTFCYSPYGWKLALEKSGLRLTYIAAGVDSFALLGFHLNRGYDVGQPSRYSIFNQIVDEAAREQAVSARNLNVWKLMFAGHMVFVAEHA